MTPSLRREPHWFGLNLRDQWRNLVMMTASRQSTKSRGLGSHGRKAPDYTPKALRSAQTRRTPR
eukprot:146095-Hanusia_phi.AAC.1